MMRTTLASLIFSILILFEPTSGQHQGERKTITTLNNGCTLTRASSSKKKSPWHLANTYPHYDCTRVKLKKIPTDIPTDVRAITLDFNEIEELDTFDLKRYVQLVHLNMKSAGLKTIIPNTSVTLGYLKTLSFPLNEVKEITAEHLKSFPNITVLRMYNNKITNIPDDLFKYTPKIYELYIGPNPLNRFNGDSLKYLKEVFSMSLRNISLTSVPRLDMPILKYADLSDNHITELKNDSFVGCPSLYLISLENNAISDIAHLAFRNNSQLSSIDLSENKISRLRKRVFDQVSKDNLMIELWANKLSCDCTMKWFKEWIEMLESDDPITEIRFHCSTPVRMYGKRSDQLSPGDFICKTTDRTYTDDNSLEEAIYRYHYGHCYNTALLALVVITSLLSTFLICVILWLCYNRTQKRFSPYQIVSQSQIKLTEA